VFEHFKRPVALALLASWHSWLKVGGRVHIEVPDFDSTARIVLSRLSKERDKKIATRHIFGSNEADWAVHYDGWSKKRFTELMGLCGFEVIELKQTAYLATRNITVIARKNNKTFTKAEWSKVAKNYLSAFTLDGSTSEANVLNAWLKDFNIQLDKTFAAK
jgi:hypothetical protein